MPDDIFKKLPKFGKINFGTAKYTSAALTFVQALVYALF